MKKAKIIYGIYILCILTITIYLSIQIIEGNFKEFAFKLTQIILKQTGKYTLVIPSLEKDNNTNCPCKKVGNESPGCKSATMRKSKNPLISVEPIPNSEEIYDGFEVCLPPVIVKINSQGFRDREYSVEKPNNTFRIIVLGDSFTFGVSVRSEDTYPKVLEQILNQNTSKSYEVLNFGVRGFNMLEKIEFFKEKGIKFNPDLVIVQYTDDDFFNSTRLREIQEELFHEFIKIKNITNTSTIKISDEAKIAVKANEIYYNEVMENFDDAWEKFVENPLYDLKNLSNKTNFKVLLVTVGGFERMKKLANQYDWPIVDTDKIYEEGMAKVILDEKDTHWNSYGHELVAKIIYEELKSLDIVN
jgi:hypothetical protein